MSPEAGYTGGERADGLRRGLHQHRGLRDERAGPYDPAVIWERPNFPYVFAVGFDIYNGSDTENTVSLQWLGRRSGRQLVTAFDLNNGVFNHVQGRGDEGRRGTRSSASRSPRTAWGPPGRR